MVMPRSRSMSIESRYCAFMLRGSTAPQISSRRSANVDFPWSTWATMATARMCWRDCAVTGSVARVEINETDQREPVSVPAQVLGHALGQQWQTHLERV